MSSDILTVGLSVYNDEDFLEDCIQSVLNQTFSEFKFIIVDDGSADSSISIIKQFDDPRIKFLNDGVNRQLPYRLNQIADLVDTKYLARMDADCIMEKHRFEKQIKVLEQNPEIDVLGTNAYSIDASNNIRGLSLNFNDSVNSRNLFKVKRFVHPTITGKTTWFNNNKYDEKAIRIEDAELWDRARKGSEFYVLDEPLLFYREFGGDYYQKYKKSIPSFFYVSKKSFLKKNYKRGFNWLYKGIRGILKSVFYKFYSLLGMEDSLIKRRFYSLNKNSIEEAKQVLRGSV